MEPTLDELLALRAKKKEREAILGATESGGIGGALMGGVGSVLSGGTNLGSILKAAAKGGLAGGAIGGGSQFVGNELMGSPDDGQPGAYGTRGVVGGAIAGGLGGAALGGLLGSGKLNWLSKIAPIEKAVAESGQTNNIVANKIRKWMAEHGTGAAPRVAAALGITGAGLGALKGGEEGIDLDYLNSLKDDENEPT